MCLVYQVKTSCFFSTHHNASKQVIGLEGLHNLSFALQVLEQLGDEKNSKLLENQIIKWMSLKLKDNRHTFDKMNMFGEINPVFLDFSSNYQEENKLNDLPKLIEVVYRYIYVESWSSEHVLALENSKKADWEQLLFKEIPHDKRFQNINSSQVIKKMISQYMKPEMNSKIKQMVIDIYLKRGKESVFYKKYMDYLISRLED
ncbi:hypothetical protein [Acinetobacter sp. 88816]|uniref:hypothetical protein n=1 Tax=Acinetobacter sp. 88816 TaxID=1310761 RepID=UPI0004B85B45|nr:hypothetical protein [Acinetobacter sp. 88816]